MASRVMPRLMAWVARVCRSWCGGDVADAGCVRPTLASARSTRWSLIGRPCSMKTGESAAQAGRVGGGEPVVEQVFELRVQRDVAVVVQLADRDRAASRPSRSGRRRRR